MLNVDHETHCAQTMRKVAGSSMRFAKHLQVASVVMHNDVQLWDGLRGLRQERVPLR
jgi:hypothetical protein